MKLTTTKEKLISLARAAHKGCKFATFDYTKEVKGVVETRKRRVMLGAKIAKAQEARGEPLKKKGSWMTGSRYGRNGIFVKRGGKFYLSAYDMDEIVGEKQGKIKMFCVDQISNISGSKE